MKKPGSFAEAFEILDRAIDDIDEPKLGSLIDCEIRAMKVNARDEIALGFRRVERSVREHPVLYIGGAAAAVFTIGFLISHRTEVSV